MWVQGALRYSFGQKSSADAINQLRRDRRSYTFTFLDPIMFVRAQNPCPERTFLVRGRPEFAQLQPVCPSPSKLPIMVNIRQ